MLRIALNMMTGIENPYIEYRDSLSDQNADKDQYLKSSLKEAWMQKDLLKFARQRKRNFYFLLCS